jgi:hypothetical protein
MKWKGGGRKRSWPNLRYYAGICLEGLKNHKNLSEYSRSPRRDLGPTRPEYEDHKAVRILAKLNFVVKALYRHTASAQRNVSQDSTRVITVLYMTLLEPAV